MKKIRWGILGPGNIANRFVEGLKVLAEAELYAIGSRSKEKAEAFGEKYGVSKEKCYGSYEELARDTNIDVIYVAVPHMFHKEHSIMCMKHGKAVLCEKPVAMNEDEIKEMVQAAEQNKVFFMEAMWSRFLPTAVLVRKWITEGRIGETRMLQADFGFRSKWEPLSRLLNPALGGGALLDVGIYVVSLSSFIFGEAPVKINSMSWIGKSGVDEETIINLGYGKGRLSSLQCAVRTETPQNAYILGTEGRICMPKFWGGERATLYSHGEEENVYLPFIANGFEYEISEVNQCINDGKLQSDIMSWKESIEIMKTLDSIKAQWDA